MSTTHWKDRLFVFIQLVLFIFYCAPIHISNFLEIKVPGQLGAIVSILGFLLTVGSIWQLRHSLSPFPSPRKNSELIKSGLFGKIRHPIYTGILLLTFGYACHSGSVWRLIVTLSLLLLFHFKSRYEEELLKRKFPDYASYIEKTGRFLPRFSLK